VALLAELVDSPTLSPLLGYLVRPRVVPDVDHVALVEDLARMETVDEGALVLLTPAASALSGSYRFDIALRVARTRGVAAMVLVGPGGASITATAAAIADRAGIGILGVGGAIDLAQLAVAISRELAGGAEAALLRTHAAMRVVETHPADGATPALIEHVGAAIGVPITLAGTEPDSGPRVPIVVDGHVEGWLSASAQGGDLGMGLDVALHMAAIGAERALVQARRERELPLQSRADVLTQLLAAPPQARERLAFRARNLGVPVDGWHVAVRVEFEQLADAPDEDDLSVFRAREEFAREALHEVGRNGDAWYLARTGLAPILLCVYGTDPGTSAPASVAKVMEDALGRLRPRMPMTLVRCGVGGAHQGVDGLLASVDEARAAATAARTMSWAGAPVQFDRAGLRRTLVEWYASDTAQDAVATVLAPLVDLGGARSERLIKTLHVYLDNQGSLTRTAEALSLHRNAVSYRINQVFSLLDVDPENPDDRLLLQLACRARDMAH
jgi:sugar diacid utilization regulator